MVKKTFLILRSSFVHFSILKLFSIFVIISSVMGDNKQIRSAVKAYAIKYKNKSL